MSNSENLLGAFTPSSVGQDLRSRESADFARALIAWRLSRGWTQDDLAMHSKVSRAAISLAERGANAHPPKPITQSRLAAAFGITVEQLLQPPGDEYRGAIRAFVEHSGEGHGTAASLVNANQHIRRDIKSLVFPVSWLQGLSTKPDTLSFVMAEDNANAPAVNKGDVVMLEPATQIDAGIYLLHDRITQGAEISPVATLRRLIPTAGGNYRMTYANPSYCDSDCVVRGSDISVLAKVAFVISAKAIE